MGKKSTLVFGGDTSIGQEGAKFMEGVLPVLENADVRMVHLEEPFMKEPSEKVTMDRTTSSLRPLIGRVELMTLCSNHWYDFGEPGIEDTMDWCRENGILTSGGGRNIEEACQPAFFEKDGVRYGVVSFNAIGPTSSFASETKGGCAYIGFRRAYIPDAEKDWRAQHRLEYDVHSIREPVELSGTGMAHNFPDITSWDKAASEIAAAKVHCDILVVYFH